MLGWTRPWLVGICLLGLVYIIFFPGINTRSLPDLQRKFLVNDSNPVTYLYCDDKSLCGGDLKVISTSLYGQSVRYCHGAVRNSEIAKNAFPDWQLWVFVARDGYNSTRVPSNVTDAITANGGVVFPLHNDTVNSAGFGMNWRFLVSDNKTISRFVVRDGDSRLLLRDRYALDEWEASKLPYHVARDHTSHTPYPISGGMWGAVKEAPTPNLLEHLSKTPTSQKIDRVHDMDFLNTLVWPIMQASGVRQHDAFSCNKYKAEGVATGWPYRRAGGEHVGAVYESGDVSRPLDLQLLPSHDSCPSPQYPAANRTTIVLSQLDSCNAPACVRASPFGTVRIPNHELFSSYELRYMFIDAASHCENGTAQLPVLFNYTSFVQFPTRRLQCKPPDSSSIKQYDERVKHPKTHYDVFIPDGLQYFRLLFVVDALYTDNVTTALAEGLPALAYVLPRMPSYARLMLRDSKATDAMMEAAGRLGLLRWQDRVLKPNALIEWRAAPWAAVHTTANSLWWAYRVVVLTSDNLLLASAKSILHNVVQFATARYQLSATKLDKTSMPPGCQVARVSNSVLTGIQGSTPVANSPHEVLDILTKLTAVVVTASEPHTFLGFIRPHALLLILSSEDEFKQFMPFCSVAPGMCVRLHKDARMDLVSTTLKRHGCYPK